MMLDKKDARRIARKHILWNIGNVPGVDKPFFGEYFGRNVWYVPIVIKTKELDLEDIDRIVLDSNSGEVIRAPTKEELQKKIDLLKSIKLVLPDELVSAKKEVLRGIARGIYA